MSETPPPLGRTSEQTGVATFVVRDGIILHGITEESLFGFEFFTFRSPPAMAEMDAFIRYAKGKTCFIDVGANAGIFSCVFQTLNHAACYAFEPSEAYYPHLMANTRDLHVICNQFGLSDHTGTLSGHIEDRMFIAGDVELLGIDPMTHNKLLEVQVSTGDLFIETRRIPPKPDLMKIDVEGHETKVLRGLQTTITNYRPTILLETHHLYLDKTGGQEELAEVLASLPEHKTETIGPNHSVLLFQ